MPRKRFARYEYGLKKLMRTGTTTAAEPPAGSALAEYVKYKSGKKVVAGYKVTAKQGTEEVAIKPFGVNPASTFKVVTKITGRTAAAKVTLLESDAIFGHSQPGDNDEREAGFSPALAIILKSGTSTTSTESKITGIPYKKKNSSDSYTIPFGQSGASGSDFYLTAQQAIITAVELKDKADGSNSYSVSFKPERQYRS